MTAPDDDDGLLDVLGRALRQADPVPDRVKEAALAAFSWRTIDAELAALVYDSGMELTSGARSDEVARQLTFAAGDLEIEVMVAPDGEQLLGQLVPPQVATVSLTRDGEVLETTSDALGRFRFDLSASGPVRLSVPQGAGQPPVETEWVVL